MLQIRASRRLSKLPTRTETEEEAAIVEESDKWRLTIFALEMFLAKSEDGNCGLDGGHVLMNPFFELLGRCERANWRPGDGDAGSYAVDLLLSCALKVMEMAEVGGLMV